MKRSRSSVAWESWGEPVFQLTASSQLGESLAWGWGNFKATERATSGAEAKLKRNGKNYYDLFDNLVNSANLTPVMSNDNIKPKTLKDIGQMLVEHSKSTEFTANRGLVVELFPFIFEASERMSARAISRFLQEQQNIRLSAVTITKALNDPKRSWVGFFEGIQPQAIAVAKWFRPASFKFLYVSKSSFDDKFSFDKEGLIGAAVARGAMALLRPEVSAAVKVLREKWFTIGMGTRLKAQPYLEEHLMALGDKF